MIENVENNEEDVLTEQVSEFENKSTTFEPTNVGEIQQRVINRLNHELGSNIENLTKCPEMMDQVLLHKKSIEQSVKHTKFPFVFMLYHTYLLYLSKLSHFHIYILLFLIGSFSITIKEQILANSQRMLTSSGLPPE